MLLISMAAAVQPDMVADHLDTLLQVHASLCFRQLVLDLFSLMGQESFSLMGQESKSQSSEVQLQVLLHFS